MGDFCLGSSAKTDRADQQENHLCRLWWSPGGRSLKRLAADWLILTAAVVTVVLATVLLASGPIYADAVTLSALQRSTDMDEAALAEMRRSKVGFIFQAFRLIPILSAAENVEVPLRLVRDRP